MISMSHMKALSKSKPTDVWCLDSLGEHSIRFDRLSLCSQIKAIPIEDVVAMLEEIDKEFDKQYYINRHELHDDSLNVGLQQGQNIILRKINALEGAEGEHNN